jgi:hypothetical protein
VGGLGLVGMTISRGSVSTKAWMSKCHGRRQAEDGEEALVEIGMVSEYSGERRQASSR